MKVKDVMVKEIISVLPSTRAVEALQVLQSLQMSGLPVLDKEGTLLGMFTEKDVLAFVLPSYVLKVGKFIYEENPKAVRHKFTELGTMTVRDLMREVVVTTSAETSLYEAARIMLTLKSRRLPVVDAAGRVVGIVARSDVLKALAHEAEQGAGPQKKSDG